MQQQNNNTDFGQIGREMAREQARIEKRRSRPETGTAFMTSIIMWAVIIAAGFVVTDNDLAGWIAVAVVVIVFLAGIFWRPLRSGFAPVIVTVVPIWGMVARLDRVSTCVKLRKAKIYTDPDKTKVIPATTWKASGDIFVKFNGAGESGMNPDRIHDRLVEDARVWGARSFAISEDRENPGVITLQLSRAAAVHTSLDDAITGVIA
ncbi:hypothetical protein [Bifidobacterium olomucense]|uniref:Uncharacterized protein n=1 Tax=Bifidobacterium olomucense TaxID=2675324 RepID=A0A7Y0EZS6_9BIFI|nr:hypothetical protein [Bifidobacterium sp. DSM 109959]NMM99372.1 hypothetical protein [Bifidobacterium sp. DSM 109959]